MIHARIEIDYFLKSYMTPFRPTSYDRPGEQISTTPSGLKVTSAKRLMVDSMVRMIQKAENHSVEDKLDEESSNN
jgi:hypothetical protein